MSECLLATKEQNQRWRKIRNSSKCLKSIVVHVRNSPSIIKTITLLWIEQSGPTNGTGKPRTQDAGLNLNPVMCEWAWEEKWYLGYQLRWGEVRPQVDKVTALRDCAWPRTRKAVWSFLGPVSWFRWFVQQFATIAAPLTALTGKNYINPLSSSDNCEAAFHILKAYFCSFPVLKSSDLTQNFLVQVAASAVGLGAVVAQGDPQEEHPILYLSCKLQPRETRYSTVE